MYREGEPISHHFPHLANLEPHGELPRVVSLAQTGLFAIGRQWTEQFLAHRPNSLTLGVRDPYRIDPAVHVTTLGFDRLQAMSPDRRLRLFHRLPMATHPDRKNVG